MLRHVIAMIGCAFAIGSASAQEDRQTTFSCDGRFFDGGRVSAQATPYRVNRDGVQVWDGQDRHWTRYSCLARCFADRRRPTVADSYATTERGSVGYDLDLATGHLVEAWRVRDDVLQFVASCRVAADPHPAAVVVEPSTSRRHDYAISGIADGLPLPAPRHWYELRLRDGGVEGRLL